jgi:hypothetical protein
MSVTDKKTLSFHYTAHGHGLSAQFTRPFNELIDVQAGMSLPIIGGHGFSRVDNFKFKEVLSFKSAYTHVSGSQSPEGKYDTLVTSVVEGLNILDVLTVDKIVCRVASDHVPGEPEPHITPLGSKFENLQISCHKMKVELDCALFTELDTFSSFKERYEKDKTFRDSARERFLWGPLGKDVPEFVRTRYNWSKGDGFPDSRGAVLCSLVKKIEDPCPGVQVFGNVVVVPEFGRVFLAEFLVERYCRRLTMLRVELGCSVGGGVTGGEGSSNGSVW